MKKLFVLISALLLIGSITFAQDLKPAKDLKQGKAILSEKPGKVERMTRNEIPVQRGNEGKQVTTTVQENQNGPEITFKETNHDFGQIPFKGNGSYEFVFENTGNEPLILSQPKSSCGCTVPEWPKEPILPGQTNCIKVTYKNTDRPGTFNKYVTVFSNALVNKEVKLHIKGTVEPQPTDATPMKVESIGSPVNQKQ